MMVCLGSLVYTLALEVLCPMYIWPKTLAVDMPLLFIEGRKAGRCSEAPPAGVAGEGFVSAVA